MSDENYSRVLHIIPNLHVGGAESMLLKLLSKADSPQNHLIVTLLPGGALLPQILDTGCEVRILNVRRLLSFLWAFVGLCRALRKMEITCISCWMYYGCVIGSLLETILRTNNLVWNIRHSLSDLRYERWRIRVAIRVLAWIVRMPRLVVYNSKVSFQQHLLVWGEGVKSIVIPNGFDADAFPGRKMLPTELGRLVKCEVSDRAFVFGCVARVHPMKNHEGLLRAFDLVSCDYPQACLVLIGRGTQQLDLTSVRAKDRVLALGERLDAHGLMAGLNGLVMCSSYGEGFPNVVAEAVLSGVPALVTDVGDATSISTIPDWTIPGFDAEDIAKVMKALLVAPSDVTLQRIVEARERVIQNFAIESVLTRFENIWYRRNRRIGA